MNLWLWLGLAVGIASSLAGLAAALVPVAGAVALRLRVADSLAAGSRWDGPGWVVAAGWRGRLRWAGLHVGVRGAVAWAEESLHWRIFWQAGVGRWSIHGQMGHPARKTVGGHAGRRQGPRWLARAFGLAAAIAREAARRAASRRPSGPWQAALEGVGQGLLPRVRWSVVRARAELGLSDAMATSLVCAGMQAAVAAALARRGAPRPPGLRLELYPRFGTAGAAVRLHVEASLRGVWLSLALLNGLRKGWAAARARRPPQPAASATSALA